MCRIKAPRNDDSTDLYSKTRNIKSDIRDALNRFETEFGIDMTLFCHWNFWDVNDVRPAAGIKICLGANRPLIGHSGVLLTPYARRVNGINEVTSIDPSLAPPGKHLIMSHQALQSDDIQSEIELGLKDLEDIFHKDDYEVLMVQTYRDGWPVNRAGSGSDLGNTTPIKGLYIVGDGAKGNGGIEVEGVALGVENTIGLLQNFKTNYAR